jgi:DNA replication protein DnaC
MTASKSKALDAEVEALARRLRLPYLRKAAQDVLLPTAKAQRWVPAEVVRVLLEEEATGRDVAAIRNRRRRAGFPTGNTFDTWRDTASTIPPSTQQALRTLEWIRRAENLAVVGPSGTGKSHLLEALGNAAIDDGLTVAWFGIESLGRLVTRHRADDSVAKAVNRALKADLVVIDDIGLLPVPVRREHDEGPDRSRSLRTHTGQRREVCSPTCSQGTRSACRSQCPVHRGR